MDSDKADKALETSSTPAKLRAIVAVEEKDRVRCQQPGCGHSVHAAIHVVEEEGRLLVLGSTCFARRYGNAHALGKPGYGSGGGRKLTDEELEMLLRNTAALLARFVEEEAAAAKAEAARLEELRRRQPALEKANSPPEVYEARHLPQVPRRGSPGLAPERPSPWSWQMARTSIALFTAPDGKHWVRVQHQDGPQKLVPWPHFAGWETALPPEIGIADTSLGAIAVDNILEAIRILQRNGFRGPVVGAWQQVLPRRVTP